ncbi:MAG: leucyl aminopeptidase [Bacillota bacterium]|nr:leucyl aminopeptidase [Bacillota bacterium]MDW7676625.1 leucyl aminopeptidase [Bacillota bacterium]
MNCQVITEKPGTIMADVLVMGLHEGAVSLSNENKELDRYLEGQLSEVLDEGVFKGKEGQTVMLFSRSRIPAKRLLLMGLGKKEKFSGEILRKTAATALREAEKVKAVTLAMPSFGEGEMAPEEIGRCLGEGLYLGAYRFLQYKSKETDNGEEPTVKQVLLYLKDRHLKSLVEAGLEEGQVLAEGVITARNLVNEPPNVMDPEAMARRAKEIARHNGMGVEILEREDMEKLKMGCLLGVTSGSQRAPKIAVLTYEGAGKDTNEVIGLVGKGLTFDSGGISLKPGAGMDEMKGDMAGAAAVLGAMEIIGRLKPDVNVIAVVGLCENMPSGTAYRPGDILTAMNGKTVEVLNTDAEGRLVLADCLCYAQQIGATRLVDVATLTGACVIALGNHATGVVSNDDAWQQAVVDAGLAAGESCWPLPAFDEYAEQLKSDVADLQNIGGKEAGAVTAGLFLKAFVDNRPWVHLDIAGTSYTKKPKAYQTKGGTGVAARILAHLVKNWGKSG